MRRKSLSRHRRSPSPTENDFDLQPDHGARDLITGETTFHSPLRAKKHGIYEILPFGA